ncbi:MAG: hypothetical protein ACOYNZ_13550 [Rhodoferax sp.]
MAKSLDFSGEQEDDWRERLSASLNKLVDAALVQLRDEQITWRSAATSLEKLGVPLDIICKVLLPYSGKVVSNDVDRRHSTNQRELVDWILSLLDKEGISWGIAAQSLDNAGISVATICRVLSSYGSEEITQREAPMKSVSMVGPPVKRINQ